MCLVTIGKLGTTIRFAPRTQTPKCRCALTGMQPLAKINLTTIRSILEVNLYTKHRQRVDVGDYFPDLTTNDPEKQKQGDSGGLTLDATGAENHCTLLVIEPSSLDQNLLWVASDDGRVHLTRNGGTDWLEVTKNIKGLPAGSWITQIKASNKNKGEALLVANDYRRFNYTPYAYRTTNYGKTWKRIVDQTDVKAMHCVL